MARALAAMGCVVLRFDFSGVGDSKVRQDHLPTEKSSLIETQEAMDFLRSSRGIERFVLMGICSGGSMAFEAACCDSRVVGAFVINARYHLSDDHIDFDSKISSLALARHYGRIAFASSFKGKNWLKILTGRVDYSTVLKALLGFPFSRLRARLSKASGAGHLVADLRALSERGVRLLHLYSEGDQSLDCCHVAVDQMDPKEKVQERMNAEVIRGANHASTMLWSQDEVLRIGCDWMREIAKGEPARLHAAS